MKNLLLLLSVAAIFLSSCSSKIGIAKRKYGKGYYVSVSHKPKSTLQNSTPETQQPKVKSEEVAQVRVYPSVQLGSTQRVTEAQTTQAQVNHNQLTASKKDKSGLKSVVASASRSSDFGSKQIVKALSSAGLQKASSDKSASDTNTILLVILCLFWWLNLIAVYLHQGKKITNDFWITLILDLTFILGVVYSILVVLDVLSFA